ncbi:MAG: hypothetical protein MJZ84_07235 [Paludibacteraceae bacterium]|nr:hypothetical protein [Paludibacteraceae bacterium]
MFRRYKKGNSEFMDVKLIYAAVTQLRETQEISMSNPPMILPIDFEGLTRNADGYYKLEDVIQRFDDTMAEFDILAK